MKPTPENVKQARAAVGLSQSAAARLIHSALRSWQDWEAGKRKMHPAMWELFLTKTNSARVRRQDETTTDEGAQHD